MNSFIRYDFEHDINIYPIFDPHFGSANHCEKEFQEYLDGKGKLKVFRLEAVKVGFAKLWKEKDYTSIVKIAERLPEQTVQEDPNILMYYDISLSRV